MPECYICGAYIEPGRGYRRNIETGTSVNYHFTKRGGTSYGVRYGLRTLCRVCAHIEDRNSEGRAARGVGYLVGWGLSAYIGLQAFSQANTGLMKLIGIAFLLGLPVFVLKYFIDQHLQDEIAGEIEAMTSGYVEEEPPTGKLTAAAREAADEAAARKTNSEIVSALQLPALALLAIGAVLVIVLMFNM